MPQASRSAVSYLPFVLGCAFLCLSACAEGVERSPFAHEVSDLVPDARVTYGELPNGLRYAVMENDTPEATASLRMRIAAGSLNEAKDELGIAHYLEHMAFNGSKQIPEGQMIKRLERHGLSFGADTNAHTSFDETVYKLNLPNVDADTLDEAFMLMRETASNLTLEAGAIDRERGIIHSEKRTRNSVAFKKMVAEWEFFTRDSGLTEHLPIGTDETIDSVQAEQFRDFYDANYHPSKAFVVFVGDLPTSEALARIEATFGDWQGARSPGPIAGTGRATMRPGDVGYYQDPELMTSVTFAVLHPFEETVDTVETRRTRLVERLGMAMLSQRLLKKTYEEDTILLAGSARRGSIFDTTNVSQLVMRSEAENWQEALMLAEQELRKALEHGFSEAELKIPMDSILSGAERRASEANTPKTHGRMGSGIVDQIVGSYGSDRVLEHPVDALDRIQIMLNSISIEEVNSVFNALWNGSENPMVYLSTSIDVQDPEFAVRNALTESRARSIEAPKADLETQFAYTDFGQPGEVVEATRHEDLDAHTVRFGNNVLLNFKQTDFTESEVYVVAQVGDGALSLSRKDEGLRRLALNILNKGGLKAHPVIELRELLASYETSHRLFFSEDSDSILMSGRSTPEDLWQLLNVLSAYASEPGLRESAGDRYKRSISAWYPTHDATPSGVASRELPRLVRSGDARFGHPDLEGFLAPEHSEAADWLERQLTSGMIEVTIVGDVDTQEAIAQVARTFGALPERAAERGQYPERTRLIFPERTEDILTFTHAGEPDQALLRIYWPAPDGSDAARTQNMRVLQSVFRNRLVDEIREKEAAAYSPGVGRYSSPIFSGYGYLLVSLDLTPETVSPILGRVEDVAGALYEGGVTEDEFVRALTPLKEDLTARLQSNGYWLNVLNDMQSDGFGIQSHRATLSTYQSATVADVEALAREVFAPGRSIRVQIVPDKDES